MKRFVAPLVAPSLVALGALALIASVAVAAAPADYGLLDGARRGALLRAGASGATVTALQHALTEASAPTPATGSFDADTVAAVRSFQGSRGITVDGVVGPETMRALDLALGVTRLRRMRDSEITPAIRAHAIQILHDHGQDPFGTEVPFVADGRRYVGRIERHYHKPGGRMRPWGYHHGVSIFEVV